MSQSSDDRILKSAEQDLQSLIDDRDIPRILDDRESELNTSIEHHTKSLDKARSSMTWLQNYRMTLPDQIVIATARVAALRVSGTTRVENVKRTRLESEMDSILAKIAGSGFSIDDVMKCLNNKGDAVQ